MQDLNWRARKILELTPFYYLPAFEWHRRKKQNGPECRNNEYSFYIKWLWGGIYINLETGPAIVIK